MMPRALSSMINRAQRGVALLEALLAVVLLAIGLIGTLALQARSMSILTESALRAEATVAANQLLGVMNNDQNNLPAYAVVSGAAPGPRLSAWAVELRKNIPGATIQVDVTPAADASRTMVAIQIGWRRTGNGPANTHRITSYLAPTQ